MSTTRSRSADVLSEAGSLTDKAKDIVSSHDKKDHTQEQPTAGSEKEGVGEKIKNAVKADQQAEKEGDAYGGLMENKSQ